MERKQQQDEPAQTAAAASGSKRKLQRRIVTDEEDYDKDDVTGESLLPVTDASTSVATRMLRILRGDDRHHAEHACRARAAWAKFQPSMYRRSRSAHIDSLVSRLGLFQLTPTAATAMPSSRRELNIALSVDVASSSLCLRLASSHETAEAALTTLYGCLLIKHALLKRPLCESYRSSALASDRLGHTLESCRNDDEVQWLLTAAGSSVGPSHRGVTRAEYWTRRSEWLLWQHVVCIACPATVCSPLSRQNIRMAHMRHMALHDAESGAATISIEGVLCTAHPTIAHLLSCASQGKDVDVASHVHYTRRIRKLPWKVHADVGSVDARLGMRLARHLRRTASLFGFSDTAFDANMDALASERASWEHLSWLSFAIGLCEASALLPLVSTVCNAPVVLVVAPVIHKERVWLFHIDLPSLDMQRRMTLLGPSLSAQAASVDLNTGRVSVNEMAAFCIASDSTTSGDAYGWSDAAIKRATLCLAPAVPTPTAIEDEYEALRENSTAVGSLPRLETLIDAALAQIAYLLCSRRIVPQPPDAETRALAAKRLKLAPSRYARPSVSFR